eukprot:Nk52_evm41s153 gene=Nk52_evmTU41s153
MSDNNKDSAQRKSSSPTSSFSSTSASSSSSPPPPATGPAHGTNHQPSSDSPLSPPPQPPSGSPDGESVYFACQRCAQPIRLHPSLVDVEIPHSMGGTGASGSAGGGGTGTGAAMMGEITSPLVSIARPEMHRRSPSPSSPAALRSPFAAGAGEGGAALRRRSGSGREEEDKEGDGGKEKKEMCDYREVHGPPVRDSAPVGAGDSHAAAIFRSGRRRSGKKAATVATQHNQSQGQQNAKAILFASKLFDVVSGLSEVDHPMCVECADRLLERFDEHLNEARRERDEYQDYLHLHRTAQGAGGESGEGAEEEEVTVADIEALRLEEQRLRDEILGIEDQREQLRVDMARLEVEQEDILKEEMQFWKNNNDLHRLFLHHHDEKCSLEARNVYAMDQLNILKRTNIYNDAFHIWHDGNFGTINGFRLGRLPNIPVEWNEINAAWGHTCLLFFTMAHKLNFKFKRYKLIPLGSWSRVKRLNDDYDLELFANHGVTKFFWGARFDMAMIAFLDCLQQFMEHIEGQDVHFKPPYFIQKDRIGDGNNRVSIKIQGGNTDENWTKALKFMLTDLKWCLAWVCKMVNS